MPRGRRCMGGVGGEEEGGTGGYRGERAPSPGRHLEKSQHADSNKDMEGKGYLQEGHHAMAVIYASDRQMQLLLESFHHSLPLLNTHGVRGIRVCFQSPHVAVPADLTYATVAHASSSDSGVCCWSLLSMRLAVHELMCSLEHSWCQELQHVEVAAVVSHVQTHMSHAAMHQSRRVVHAKPTGVCA